MAYPDPTAAVEAPRPYRNRDDMTDEGAETTENPFEAHIAGVWPSSSNGAHGFITLDDYFQLGQAKLGSRATPNKQRVDENEDEDGEDDMEGPDDGSDDYDQILGMMTGFSSEVDFPHSSAPDRDSRSHSNRLNSARGGRRTRGAKRAPRGWKSLIKGTEHAKLFKTPRLHRQAGGEDMRLRGTKRGVRKEIEPGAEFRKLYNQAMAAWVRQDYTAAEQMALDTVRLNPEVRDAYDLLSGVLFDQGREFEALLVKHGGASVARNSDLYIEVAEQWLNMYSRDEDSRCLTLALNDFREALKSQSSNCRIRRGMRDTYDLLGDYKAAKLMSKSILRFEPGDLENLQKLVGFCAVDENLAEMQRVKVAFEEAFRLNGENNIILDRGAQWTYLGVYIEILDRIGAYAEGVLQLKKMARALLGRQDEVFWDRFQEDDREFDTDNDRRNYVWEFQQGRASNDKGSYGDGLPIELRVRLGLLRLKMGPTYVAEAQRHLDHLYGLRDDIDDLHDLFAESAATLKASGLLQTALDFWEVLKTEPELMDEKSYMGLAQCYSSLKRYEDAVGCYSVVIEQDETNVDARVQLAKLYEILGFRDKAQDLADEVIRLGHEKTLLRERILLQKPRLARMPGRQPTASAANGATTPRNILPRPLAPANFSPRSSALLHKPSFARTKAHEIPRSFSNVVQDEDMLDVPDSVDAYGEAGRAWTGEKSSPRRKADRLQEQGRFVHEHYEVVKKLWYAIDDENEDGGEDDNLESWAIHANAMLYEFRSIKTFFSRIRRRMQKFKPFTRFAYGEAMDEMAALKERLRDENDDITENTTSLGAVDAAGIQTHFHGIAFSEWHHIASDLVLLYARQVDQENCYDILQEVLLGATVFRQDAELTNITCALSIHCAMLFNDSKMLHEAARQYIHLSDYRGSMPYQLLAALVRLGLDENSAYQDANLTKFILRSVRMHDYSSMSDEMRTRQDVLDWPESKRLAERNAKLTGDQGGEHRDPLDAGLLTIHGHILCSTRTTRLGPGGITNAMTYLFRALALEPENVTLHLTIASVFLKGAMYRTARNRLHGISHGLAFFNRYYDLRVADGKAHHTQEAEFNRARFWHQLGLTDLATRGYERVLELSSGVQEDGQSADETNGYDVEDFAQEAAFALRTMYALTGNLEAARAITEKWLVL